MDFFEVVKKRRACHNFDPSVEITDEELDRLFELTMLTPSGYNIQPWEFVVIKDKKRKQELVDIAFGQSHVADASAVVIVVGDLAFAERAKETVKLWVDAGLRNEDQAQSMYASLTKERSPEQLKEMVIRNVGLVSMQLILIAEAMGFSTCPMMGFSKHQLRKFISLPDDKLPGLMIAIGKQDTSSKMTKRLPRRPIGEVVHVEHYEA